MSGDGEDITWQLLVNAYASGYFPMAEHRDSTELRWFYPQKRGILPLDTFHVPASLAKLCRKKPFVITTDKAFEAVISACADINDERKDTWINDAIISLYCELHEHGFAHSVECWERKEEKTATPVGRGSHEPRHMELSADNSGDNLTLVGGLYGVAIGGAFFGESMFSRVPNASRVALVHLVELLKGAGYTLLDTQFVNDHLKQFGVVEIPRKKYLALLKDALSVKTTDCF